MIAQQSTPISVALGSACRWLKSRPELAADPEVLLEFVCAWVCVVKPKTIELAELCGIHAVKECAGCVKDEPFPEVEVLNPEDLID